VTKGKKKSTLPQRGKIQEPRKVLRWGGKKKKKKIRQGFPGGGKRKTKSFEKKKNGQKRGGGNVDLLVRGRILKSAVWGRRKSITKHWGKNYKQIS